MRYADIASAVKWAKAHGFRVEGNWITRPVSLSLRQSGCLDYLTRNGFWSIIG